MCKSCKSVADCELTVWINNFAFRGVIVKKMIKFCVDLTEGSCSVINISDFSKMMGTAEHIRWLDDICKKKLSIEQQNAFTKKLPDAS